MSISPPRPQSTSCSVCHNGHLEEDGDLDPRIQIELEKLNSSTDVINKLEMDLEEARATFRHLLSDSGQQLSQLSRHLGSCVDRARPYYEARMRSKHALQEAQRAAARFEKASSAHDAAKEMVLLAEEGFEERGMPFDQAWQEMLNHATSKVNDAERERNLSAEEHRTKSQAYQLAECKVQQLHRSLKRAINKSRPYFELKARFNQLLDDQKRQVQLIEETIQMTKKGYAESLKQLERISEEIHELRKARACLGVREAGVGAEFPPPSPKKSLSLSSMSGVGTASTFLGSEPEPRVAETIRLHRSQIDGKVSRFPASMDDEVCLRRGLSLRGAVVATTSSSSTSRSSSIRSPSYEQLVLGSSEEETTLSLAVHSDSQKPDTNQPRLSNQVLALPQYLHARRRLSGDEDDSVSDTESLASMDVLDDDQVELLMRDVSLEGENEEDDPSSTRLPQDRY